MKEEDLEKQIAELQRQKDAINKQKEEDQKKEKSRRVKGIIGKFYKMQNTWRATVNKFSTNQINYMHIIQATKYSESSLYNIDSFSIVASPVGYYLDNGRLKFNIGHNETNAVPQKAYERNLKSGTQYDFNLFRIDDYEISEDLKTMTHKTRSYPNATWIEISSEEFYEAFRIAGEASKIMWDSYRQLLQPLGTNDHTPIATEENENLIKDLDSAAIMRLSDLVSSLDGNKVTLPLLINTLSGKVARYNYFNGTRLPELAQYELRGKAGLYLSIEGGDDGSDYEPYTTRYYISSVSIDWKEVLYPIRTKLKSVLSTADALQALKDVYNPHNWDCNYNISTYDATFTSAKLQHSQLEQVNQVIQQNLK